MAWYRTGRASSVAGSNVITGVGTLWANNVFGIAPGQTLSIPGAGQVLQYEILAVDSDTKIRIATNATTTITNSEYAIVTTVANSYSALARQTSANLAVYEKLLSDWNNITTGTGNVTIIAPDGTQMVMPSLNQINENISNKLTVQSTFLSTDLNSAVASGIYHPTSAAANLPLPVLGVMEVYVRQGGASLVQTFHATVSTVGSVNRHFVRIGTLSASVWTFSAWAELYTSLTKPALTDLPGTLPITSGGTGATTAPLARTALGLGSAAVANVVTNNTDQTAGRVMTTGSNGIGGDAVDMNSINNAFLNPTGMLSFVNATNWGGGGPTDITGSMPAHWNVLSMGTGNPSIAVGTRKAIIAIQSYNRGSGWPQCWVRAIHDTTLSPAVMLYHTNNTTVDSNGFLKKASPVVKLYGDGSSETNHESEGAISERISEGVYKISGVLGFNSDDAWGGVDGGIEIPTDKNKQPLIWVDYSLEENGDLIIKTYHRTHPTSPSFAQNTIKDYEDSQPIDIPAGRFVDLRVQMPEVEEIEPPLTEA
ncbi:pyocin knob domain-containing protein [Yersinia proxima]